MDLRLLQGHIRLKSWHSLTILRCTHHTQPPGEEQCIKDQWWQLWIWRWMDLDSIRNSCDVYYKYYHSWCPNFMKKWDFFSKKQPGTVYRIYHECVSEFVRIQIIQSFISLRFYRSSRDKISFRILELLDSVSILHHIPIKIKSTKSAGISRFW